MPNSEGSSSRAEHLVPTHIAGETQGLAELSDEELADLSPEQRYQERQRLLRQAPDFSGALAEELKRENREVPENLNLALTAIHDFQLLVKEAQDLRQQVKNESKVEEKTLALALLGEKKKKIDEYLSFGASFERAYREYLRSQNEFSDFRFKLKEITRLEGLLTDPTFKDFPPAAEPNPEEEITAKGLKARVTRRETDEIASRARLEMLTQQLRTEDGQEEAQQRREMLDALKIIYSEDSEEFQRASEELLQQAAQELPKTKAELKKEIEKLRKDVVELWEDPMVRYFYKKREMDNLMLAFARGDDVIETQSVIKHLNELHEWEQQHQRTTIGGVLVGPPGVGKTTLVRHYLEAKGRNYVYIDLSEDVTRYLLYGSKSIEFKSPIDYLKRLTEDLSDLDEETFQKFISENSGSIKNTLGATDDETAVVLIEQLQESLNQGAAALEGMGDKASRELLDRTKKAQAQIVGLAEKSYRKQLSTEFAHLVKRNGWRDGVVIAALRRGDSVLLDEFNKNKNWSSLYSLMTAKPGEKWYFADNDEYIQIPNDWRMYFTANIGKKHGVAVVGEALASRAGGKVMDVQYPGMQEEMQVALTALANIQGIFLRSAEDLSKLFYLVHDLFPKIRKYIADKPQSIPLSFRTIRDLGEKLVLYRDPKTQKHIYSRTKKSFDAAAFEILVGSYALYEDKNIPTEITKLAADMGFFLFDESIKDQVIELIGQDQYDKNVEVYSDPKTKKSFYEIAQKIRGLAKETLMSGDAMADARRGF
jgi:DNA polymerase III delta prime subunit